jgi:hypothetical protein
VIVTAGATLKTGQKTSLVKREPIPSATGEGLGDNLGAQRTPDSTSRRCVEPVSPPAAGQRRTAAAVRRV